MRPLASVRFARVIALVTALLATAPLEAAINLPPETTITSGPPDSSAANYRAHFFWTGSDPDGAVNHFDIILVDYPASNDSIGGGDNPVIVVLPAPDDPRWASTTENESLFVTLADTLRRDPRPQQGETPEDVLQHPFDRWHTLFVRAVDDSGVVDPSPAYRSFDAQTLAPTALLLPPVQPGSYFDAPPTIIFNWDGEDPVGDSTTRTPVASRWVLITSGFDISAPIPFTSYPDSLYDLPENRWSAWRPWDDGRQAIVSGLLRVGDAPGSGYYVFAVQTLDEAGAITPVFDWVTPGKNNVALIRVTAEAGPSLTVQEPALGVQTFKGDAQPIAVQAVAGQALDFSWSADASAYGGTITGYRYGWDISNPENDAEWSPWSLQNTRAPAQFSTGTHRLLVQARDNAASVVGGGYEIQILPATWSRDMLWVDDTDFQTDTFSEGSEDARWTAVFSHLTEISDLVFDSNLDVYDIAEHQNESPSLELLLDYKVVVWSCRNGANGTSGLRRTAQFVDPIAARNQNTDGSYNILNVYLANGGRLWINGFKPAEQLWPSERPFGADPNLVNVTNWDDPIRPHPGVDSLGVSSLLYRMGIEMFDVGAALGSPRATSAHYCYGFLTQGIGAPDLQLGETWAQSGTGGRSNIGIFDMPPALGSQLPPLVPPSGKSRVLYTYVSQVLEDPDQGVLYPQTADNQPALLVTKTDLANEHESMAFCGFEPFLLEAPAHEALARHLLFDAMGLVPTPVYLQHLAATFDGGAVRIHWEVERRSDPATFELHARAGAVTWVVPFTAAGDHTFDAVDRSPHLPRTGAVTYSLYAREPDQAWVLLGEQTVTLAAVPLRLQLAAPRPNPFNPRTTLAFVLPAPQHVRLDICTVDGQVVTTLVDSVRPAGAASVEWDGTDAAGREAPSGLYIARLESAGVRLTRKLMLMK